MKARRVEILVVLAVLAVDGAQAQPAPGAPEQVHVTLGPGPGELVLQFALATAPALPAEELYAIWVHNGTTQTTRAVLAGTIEGEGATDAGTTYVYAARIQVPPGGQVSYRVGSAARGYAGPFQVAAPPLGDPIRVVAMGDIGSAGVGPDGGRLPGQASPPIDIRDMALTLAPDLAIIPGDLSYANSRVGWDRFMRMYQPLQSRIPTMPAAGNHEWHDDRPEFGYSRFLNHYVLPENEQDFVFQAGPVTFIAINSDAICVGDNYRTSYGNVAEPCPYGEPDLARRDWLAGALRAAAEDETPWTLVFLHHPAYSWGSHGSDIGQQILWEPLFAQHGADLVIAAHDHLYSRSFPVIASEPMAGGHRYAKGTAPVYVVTGGGGRGLYALPDPSREPAPSWHAVGESIHHILVVDAEATQLHVRALRLDGSTIDEFTIRESTPETPSDPTPVPAPPAWLSAFGAAAGLLALSRSQRARRD